MNVIVKNLKMTLTEKTSAWAERQRNRERLANLREKYKKRKNGKGNDSLKRNVCSSLNGIMQLALWIFTYPRKATFTIFSHTTDITREILLREKFMTPEPKFMFPTKVSGKKLPKKFWMISKVFKNFFRKNLRKIATLFKKKSTGSRAKWNVCSLWMRKPVCAVRFPNRNISNTRTIFAICEITATNWKRN